MGYSQVPKFFLSLSLCPTTPLSSFSLSFPPIYPPSYPSSSPPTISPFLPFFSPSSPPLLFLVPPGGAGAIATLIHDGFMNPIDGKYRVVSSGRSTRERTNAVVMTVPINLSNNIVLLPSTSEYSVVDTNHKIILTTKFDLQRANV